MKDMKFSNIQKESEKIKIKKNINDYEDLKAQALLKLGIMTYDKIRKGEVIDEEFNSLCDEIKAFDIEIYTKHMQLRSFENKSNKIDCQCGYVAFKNEKFCPQCGKSLIEKEKCYIICNHCNQETEKDSNFCACCGSKIKEDAIHYYDEVYFVNEEAKIKDTIIEEVPEVSMIDKDSGKQFLKDKEELALEDDDFEDEIVTNNSVIETDSIEIEGREFLKGHQENRPE
ncbi:zinc ribbon domain-containing protein [Terrisporobacter petrolearius]|uniref:zinc ribbon domain-containing protein n=1 Tax=Terrisporobacter petrolearius TaxID=1460447 RepID=UPI0031CC3945